MVIFCFLVNVILKSLQFVTTRNQFGCPIFNKNGQHSSLVAHWLSGPGNHVSSPPGGGEKLFLFFLSCDLRIAIYQIIN